MDTETVMSISFLGLVCLGLALITFTGQSPFGATLTGQPVGEVPWYYRGDYFFLTFIFLPVAIFWAGYKTLGDDTTKRRWRK